MPDIDFLGRFKRYNASTNEVTLSLEFVTPDLLRVLEEACDDQSRVKVRAKTRIREMKTYGDQKAWYGSLSLILKALDISVTSEYLEVYDEEMRNSIFPTKKVIIGGKEIIKPMKMKEQTHEQMQNNIEVLQNRHSHLEINDRPIDFSNLRQG